MDTRGKSSEAIRAGIVELADGLPAGHPLRDVPKTFPDRAQAIAAFTHMRQTLFQLDRKASTTMASKKADVAAEPTKAAKAEKPTKAVKPAAADKPSKAAKANGDAKPAKAAKANGDADAPKKGRKPGVALTGPFKLSKAAADAKSPEALRMHEGSARFTLLSHVFKNASKKPKGFTTEELIAAVGDQGRQALGTAVKLGHLEAA